MDPLQEDEKDRIEQLVVEVNHLRAVNWDQLFADAEWLLAKLMEDE